jgi:hypothetical protein
MTTSNPLQDLAKKAVSDDAFRAQAQKDPKAALAGIGFKVPAGMSVKVYQNTPTEIHAVLPEKSADGVPQGTDPNVAKVFEKAWSDPKFKAELLKNPTAAIKAATNAKLPASLKIVVHENTAKEMVFVLPYVPPKSGELSDSDLEMVAGGKGGGNVNAGGCGASLATQGAVVTASAAAAGATGGALAGGLAVVAVGTMFSSFITMAVSASK